MTSHFLEKKEKGRGRRWLRRGVCFCETLRWMEWISFHIPCFLLYICPEHEFSRSEPMVQTGLWNVSVATRACPTCHQERLHFSRLPYLFIHNSTSTLSSLVTQHLLPKSWKCIISQPQSLDCFPHK